MSVIARANGQAEITFVWVQPNRGKDFDDLKGLSPTYENVKFPVSAVRLGDKEKGETQPIMFDRTGREERLVTGEYSGLINFDPKWDGPEIACIASKTEFDSVVAALEAQQEAEKAAVKAAFRSNGPRRAKPVVVPSWDTGKKEEVEDLTVYKVEVNRGGQKITVAGTLKEIVGDLTIALKKDPVDILHAESTVWQMKGADDRYRPSLIPAKIPAPSEMLLTSVNSKKGQASA